MEKPDRTNLIQYLTRHTGGSVRHAKINCIDVNQALHDLFEDLEKYYEEEKRNIQKQLIKNSQLSFDNNHIVFEREWFYQNVEEDFKLNKSEEGKARHSSQA